MSKPPVQCDEQASSSSMKRALNSTASTASLSSMNSSTLNVTVPREHLLLSDVSVESSSSFTSTQSPHIRLQIDDVQETRKKPSLKETKSAWTTIDATNQRLRAWLDVASHPWSFSRSASTDRPLEPRLTPSPPELLYDVFLGGSCGNTVWRRELVIPYLRKRCISYYNPQRPAWKESMIHEEQIAKENSRLFLFVLDPGTINATSFIEIAYFAARKAPKLVVVFLGPREWSDKAHPMDLPDRIRTVNLVEAILKRHNVPMLTSITEALDYVDEIIIGEKPWRQALSNSRQRLPYIQVKAKNAIKSTAAQIKQTVESVQASATVWTKRIAAVVGMEIILILVLLVFLPHKIPLYLLVVPIVGVDYIILALLVLYLKIKANRKRAQYKRKLVINPPSLPRTTPSSITAASSDVSSPSTNSVDVGPIQSESMCLKTVQPNQQRPVEPFFYDSIEMVDQQVRQHYQVEKPKKLKVDMKERLKQNGCMTSPVGYDVFLSCSSGSELDWITQKAVPQLHKSTLSYTSAIMCDKEMRIPLLHTASHILYYIPSYRTFLSGMIEIAYFIGHSDWQVTVCVPTEAECLVLMNENDYDEETRQAVERRNQCYQMAFCYLKDMAHRRECRVFTNVEEAVKHIAAVSQLERQEQQEQTSEQPNKKRAVLRTLMEKQHLVKEKTQANLLAHRSAVIAAATAAANASPKNRS